MSDSQGLTSSDQLVALTQQINAKLTVTRVVVPDSIQVLSFIVPNTPDGEGEVDGVPTYTVNGRTYIVKPNIPEFLKKTSAPLQTSKLKDACWSRAAAHVAENTQVFMQVEVGMTAAESANYYPPLLRAPCDSLHKTGLEMAGPSPAPCDP